MSQGGNGSRRRAPGASSSSSPRESQTNFRFVTVWGLQKGPVGTGPAGQYSGKICFIEKHGVQDEGGRHVAKYSSDPR